MSSGSLGNLFVTLSAETSNFMKGMAQTAKEVEKITKHMKKAAHEIEAFGLRLAAVGIGFVMVAEKWDLGVANAAKGIKDSFASLAVEGARILIPVMNQIAASVKTLADYVAGLTPAQREWIVGAAELAVTIISVSGAIAFVLPLFNAFAAIANMLFALGAAVFGPWIIGLGIIALAVIFLHKVWRENWGGIQEKTKAVVEAISGYWLTFKDWLLGIFDDILTTWITNVKAIADGLIVVLHATGALSDGQANIAQGLVDSATKIAKNGGLKAVAIQLGETVKDGILDGFSAMRDEATSMLKSLGDKAKGMLPSFAKGKSQNINTDQTFEVSNGTNTSTAMIEYLDQQAGLAGKVLAGVATAGKLLQTWLDGGAFRPQLLQFAESLGKSGDAARHFAEGMESVLNSAVMSFTSKMGDVGDILQAAVQGMQSGGPIGAIIGIIVAVILKLKGFSDIVDSMNKMFGRYMESINGMLQPLFDGLMNFAESIGNLFQETQKLTGSFEVIYAVMFVIGKVFDLLALSLLYIAKGIADAFGGNKDINDQVTKVSKDLQAGYHEVAPAATIAADGLSNVGTQAGKAADKFNEMLTNLPSGYKLGAAVFGATQGAGAGSAGGDATSFMGGASIPGAGAAYAQTFQMGDLLQGADYQQIFNPDGSLNTSNGSGGGDFTGAGSSGGGADQWTAAQLQAFMNAYSAAISAGATPEQATQAGTMAANARGSSSGAATAASGSGGGVSSVGSGAGIHSIGGGGSVVVHGDLVVQAKDFATLHRKIKEAAVKETKQKKRNGE